MKLSKIFALLLALCLISSVACAATFTDAHGNVIELDDSLEAYAAVTLVGADNAARQGRNQPRRPVGGRAALVRRFRRNQRGL